MFCKSYFIELAWNDLYLKIFIKVVATKNILRNKIFLSSHSYLKIIHFPFVIVSTISLSYQFILYFTFTLISALLPYFVNSQHYSPISLLLSRIHLIINLLIVFLPSQLLNLIKLYIIVIFFSPLFGYDLLSGLETIHLQNNSDDVSTNASLRKLFSKQMEMCVNIITSPILSLLKSLVVRL